MCVDGGMRKVNNSTNATPGLFRHKEVLKIFCGWGFRCHRESRAPLRFRPLSRSEQIPVGALAIELSILNNFFWNNLWIWRERRAESVLLRLLKYYLASASTSALGNYVVFAFFLRLGLNYLLADLMGIGVAVIINFLLSDRWVFKV